MNIFTDGPEDEQSQNLDYSQSPEREVASVADRSVLSPNFINGTEETEESIAGVE